MYKHTSVKPLRERLIDVSTYEKVSCSRKHPSSEYFNLPAPTRDNVHAQACQHLNCCLPLPLWGTLKDGLARGDNGHPHSPTQALGTEALSNHR